MESNNPEKEKQVIDLEQAAKKGEKPPKGEKYKYKVDETQYISETETMTGKEILIAAEKTVAGFILRQKIKGDWKTIAPDDVVDFTEPGLEKFKTIPNDQTEGSDDNLTEEKSPRRDFSLLEEEVDFLDRQGFFWETVSVTGQKWVFIHNYTVADGYNVQKAILGFMLPASYPTTQIDMAYFHPSLSRSDGQVVGALSELQIDGKTFQQWSRHRTGANPWRNGIDNITTHFPLVEAWLLKEFEKRPKNG